MGRDRLVDEIARAMARAENASEDHFEAYRHVAEAVAAVVEPLLAEKDKAAVEVIERLLRATLGNPDAGDLSLAQVCGLCGADANVLETLTREKVTAVYEDEHGSWWERKMAEKLADPEYAAAYAMEREKLGREALRFPYSQCGGLVQLEARCTDCGDLPAVEGVESWTEWRAVVTDRNGRFPDTEWDTEAEARLDVAEWPDDLEKWLERRTVWASRPVRVEEQGGEN